ncbi:hypothetical protein PF002_g29931, partial [Phytophthora fragariae]
SKRDVRYELTVRHAASPTCWRAPTTSTRPSRRGCLRHCGQAKCPWIYTFVKSYFAGSATLIGLGGHSDCAVEKRRDALEHVLPSLQKFVANHQNATACFIVASSVMQLVTDFVLRDMSDKRHPLNELCGCGCSGSLGSLRDSVCSWTKVYQRLSPAIVQAHSGPSREGPRVNASHECNTVVAWTTLTQKASMGKCIGSSHQAVVISWSGQDRQHTNTLSLAKN